MLPAQSAAVQPPLAFAATLLHTHTHTRPRPTASIVTCLAMLLRAEERKYYCTGVRREDIKLGLMNSKLCCHVIFFSLPPLKNKAVLSASSDVLTTTKPLGRIAVSPPNHEHFIRPFLWSSSQTDQRKLREDQSKDGVRDTFPRTTCQIVKGCSGFFTNGTLGSTPASIITAHFSYSSLPGD